MFTKIRSNIARRSFAGLLALGTTLAACAAQAAEITMYRDLNCGCCLAWAAHLEEGEAHSVKTVDHPDMAAVKTEHGVPGRLLILPHGDH